MIKLQERAKVRGIVERSIALSKKSKKGTWASRVMGGHSHCKNPRKQIITENE